MGSAAFEASPDISIDYAVAEKTDKAVVVPAAIGWSDVGSWSALAESPDPAQLTSRARVVMEFIQAHGASFFDEIADSAGMLPSEAEDALAELVAFGMVNSDSFGGLRALLVPGSQRGRSHGRGARRRRSLALFAMADAGRWAIVRQPAREPGSSMADSQAVEHVVRTLLKRWGVIFWKLLAREAQWLPPWRLPRFRQRSALPRGWRRHGLQSHPRN